MLDQPLCDGGVVPTGILCRRQRHAPALGHIQSVSDAESLVVGTTASVFYLRYLARSPDQRVGLPAGFTDLCYVAPPWLGGFWALFVLEAKLVRRRVVNLMLHVDEFAQEGAKAPRPTYRLGDLLPRTPGGIKAKLWLRERDPMNLHRTVRALLERLRPHDFRTLQQIYEGYRSGFVSEGR